LSTEEVGDGRPISVLNEGVSCRNCPRVDARFD
jgi:hypothetical protein